MVADGGAMTSLCKAFLFVWQPESSTYRHTALSTCPLVAPCLRVRHDRGSPSIDYSVWAGYWADCPRRMVPMEERRLKEISANADLPLTEIVRPSYSHLG